MRNPRLIMIAALAILLANIPNQLACADNSDYYDDHIPANFEIVTGTPRFGSLSSIAASDSQTLQVRTASSNHDVRVNFETNIELDAIAFSLSFQVDHAVNSEANAFVDPDESEEKIFNWTTSTFDEVADFDDIPANLYAEPGTGLVRFQIFRSYAEEAIAPFNVVAWVSSPIPFETNVSAPLTADLVSGANVSGTLSDLVVPDDSKRIFRSQSNASVVIDFSTDLCEAEPDNPGCLVLHLKTRVNTPNVDQIVSVYNWQSGQFDQIETSLEGVADQARAIDLSDSIFEHVQVSTGSIRWRIEWSPTGSTNSNSWRAEIDQAVWFTEKSETPVGWDFFGHQELRFQELLTGLPNKNAETIKQLHVDYVSGYPSINSGFWLDPIDFSGTSWAEFLNSGGVINQFLDKRISFHFHETSPTLIAPQVITFAWHCKPSVPNNNQIWFGADGNTEPTLVTEIFRIGATDIGIGKLASPIQNPTIQQYKIASFHLIGQQRFDAGGQLENAKVILTDQQGKVFLGKITNLGQNLTGRVTDILSHTPIMSGDYPSEPLVDDDSSNPLYLLAPNDELILVSSNQGRTSSPMLGAYIDEINEHIQSPSGFNLPGQVVEVYDLRTPFVFRGDIDGDGDVDFLDLNPFIALFINSSYDIKADINQDGSENFLDISPFIDLLSGR